MILKISQEEMRKIACGWIKQNEKIVVEAGCSSGNFVSLLKDKKIAKYIGVDIDKEKIKEAKKKFPSFSFIALDISKNLYLLRNCSLFISFQCLEHIKNDIEVIKAIPINSKVIFSVPNKPFHKEHIRWFELDGWIDRFSPYIKFDEIITIQNPRKKNKRSFLFRGFRK